MIVLKIDFGRAADLKTRLGNTLNFLSGGAGVGIQNSIMLLLMNKIFLIVAILVVLGGCGEFSGSSRPLRVYLDMDSLLDAQIAALSENRATLEKTAVKDGKAEKKTLSLDAGGWAKEFKILRGFNINQPKSAGAYKITKANRQVAYEPDLSLELPVRHFVFERENGKILSISANISESKHIYTSERNINLIFQDGLLEKYEIKGSQNMVFLEAVEYQILGRVIK